MKLVPLGDRVVLKQLVAEETTKSGIVIPGQSKGKAAAGRGYRCWAGRNRRRQGSEDECSSRTAGDLFQIFWNNRRDR